jgi:hypothetical protein
MDFLGTNKVFLLVILLVVVAGIAVGVYFLTAGSGSGDGWNAFGELSKEQAEQQCLECVVEKCPPNPSIDPMKTCETLVNTMACSCRGVCESQCKQMISYDPLQCTKLFCSVGINKPATTTRAATV